MKNNRIFETVPIRRFQPIRGVFFGRDKFLYLWAKTQSPQS
jgi:hypothetical protein